MTILVILEAVDRMAMQYWLPKQDMDQSRKLTICMGSINSQTRPNSPGKVNIAPLFEKHKHICNTFIGLCEQK